VDLAVSGTAALLLLLVMFTGKRRLLIDRWEGILFLILYAGYILYLLQIR
jgi:cation:H+ antiporter